MSLNTQQNEVVEAISEEVNETVDKVEEQVSDAVRKIENVTGTSDEEFEDGTYLKKKIPLLFKIFGILNIIFGIITVPISGYVIYALVVGVFNNAAVTERFTAVGIICAVLFSLTALVMAVLFIFLGVRLLRDNRRRVSMIAYLLLGLFFLKIIFAVMIVGMAGIGVSGVIEFIYLVVLATFMDPSLREERELQRKLRDMETKTDAHEGTLGRDKTGKGYLKLDFFNLFWITVIACVVGLIFETCYCFIIRGVWEDRAGLLWGPFSPIYGIGALLMVIALNRMYNKPLWITYVVSALIGGAFEFGVSLFFEKAFGILAWDYSNNFLNICGRTDIFHILAWGLLGMIFVRWIMPLLLRVLNLIPWQWRYGVTAVFAVFMLVNATLTLVAFERWTGRIMGIPPSTAIEEFVDEHYPNEWMQTRFETMSIDPGRMNS